MRTHLLLRYGLVGVLALLGLISASAASSQEVPVPGKLQAQLWVRVLSFDRALSAGAGKTLVLGILVQRHHRASLDAATEIFAAIEALGPATGSETKLRPVLVDLDHEGLGARLDQLDVAVLYVTPLRAMTVADVVRETRARGVRTITGVPQYVRDGLAIGLAVRDDRPEVLINLEAARAEGADLSSQLLNVARLVR